MIDLSSAPDALPWHYPADYWAELTAATAHLDTPVAVIHLDALRHNTHDLLARAGGRSIRVATKSVRVRSVIEAVLAVPGYRGVLAYTLAEALWLAETLPELTDIVVGYPTADRASLRRLAASERLAATVTLMADSIDQLDFIDEVVPPSERERLRLCLELDASWEPPLLGHVGVWRSPVRTPEQARSLALRMVSRPGFDLVGMMAYEAQVAGIGDRPAGRPVRGAAARWVRRESTAELTARRQAAVAAVRQVAPLEFVNGGGTGSIESTRDDPSVTDIAAGSGLLAGHLFDDYDSFTPAPAAAFALSVVRKPTAHSATLLGGGWIASGPPGVDRLPEIAWPQGLAMARREMAGEVQSPITGRAAAALHVGDRVWLRHAKSGELSEHVDSFALVENGEVVDVVPTYRGEGRTFL